MVRDMARHEQRGRGQISVCVDCRAVKADVRGRRPHHVVDCDERLRHVRSRHVDRRRMLRAVQDLRDAVVNVEVDPRERRVDRHKVAVAALDEKHRAGDRAQLVQSEFQLLVVAAYVEGDLARKVADLRAERALAVRFRAAGERGTDQAQPLHVVRDVAEIHRAQRQVRVSAAVDAALQQRADGPGQGVRRFSHGHWLLLKWSGPGHRLRKYAEDVPRPDVRQQPGRQQVQHDVLLRQLSLAIGHRFQTVRCTGRTKRRRRICPALVRQNFGGNVLVLQVLELIDAALLRRRHIACIWCRAGWRADCVGRLLRSGLHSVDRDQTAFGQLWVVGDGWRCAACSARQILMWRQRLALRCHGLAGLCRFRWPTTIPVGCLHSFFHATSRISSRATRGLCAAVFGHVDVDVRWLFFLYTLRLGDYKHRWLLRCRAARLGLHFDLDVWWWAAQRVNSSIRLQQTLYGVIGWELASLLKLMDELHQHLLGDRRFHLWELNSRRRAWCRLVLSWNARLQCG